MSALHAGEVVKSLMSPDLAFFLALALLPALALRVARLLDMQRRLDHVVAKNESKSSRQASCSTFEDRSCYPSSHTDVFDRIFDSFDQIFNL